MIREIKKENPKDGSERKEAGTTPPPPLENFMLFAMVVGCALLWLWLGKASIPSNSCSSTTI
jgi:hypothetical protein